MSEQSAPADTARQQLELATADVVRAYAAKTRANADQFADIMEDIGTNGLPAVEDCAPGKKCARPTSPASPPSARPSPDGSAVPPRRARIAFSDTAAKQLESITSEAEIHALDRALVVISVAPDAGEPIPGDTTGPSCASTPEKSSP